MVIAAVQNFYVKSNTNLSSKNNSPSFGYGLSYEMLSFKNYLKTVQNPQKRSIVLDIKQFLIEKRELLIQKMDEARTNTGSKTQMDYPSIKIGFKNTKEQGPA